jgi:nitrite reductase/ring-hydroxylating ferredoxin subunit
MDKALDMHRLCNEADVAEGRTRGFDPLDTGTDTVFLVRWQGRLHAWRNACPHIAGAPMAWKRDAYMNAAGTHVACHAHGALFEPGTGLCIQGPCEGRSMGRLALRVDAAGEVFVQEHVF